MKSNEVEKALELIEAINLPDANLEQIKRGLIVLVRKAGAGAYGDRGKHREQMIKEVQDDPSLKDRLLQLLESDSPQIRSWAGSFVEQLLENSQATKLIAKAIRAENDANSASWMALGLARLHRGDNDPQVCKLIEETYDRFTGADASLHIARAWGYAGCPHAIPILTGYLETGGYDQKMAALDGLIHFPGLDNKDTITALLHLIETADWDDMRQRCAEVVSQVGHRQRVLVISRLVRLLVVEESSDGHRQAALKALKRINIPLAEANLIRQELIDALYSADANLRSMITELLENSFEEWEEILVDLILESTDMKSVLPLARALAVDRDSRAYAVKMLEEASTTADANQKERIAAALKEVGGEQAFESVSAILQARYIEPSDRLQTTSEEIFLETVERMRSNYDTAIRLNRIVFWLGFGVIVAGIVTVIIDPGNKFFGAAGVVSGLGTLVSLFFFGPIGRIQKSLENLVLIEVSFMSFMHRILQARSIFEQQYVSGNIDLKSLKAFDRLLDEGMVNTVNVLQQLKVKDRSTEEGRPDA